MILPRETLHVNSNVKRSISHRYSLEGILWVTLHMQHGITELHITINMNEEFELPHL